MAATPFLRGCDRGPKRRTSGVAAVLAVAEDTLVPTRWLLKEAAPLRDEAQPGGRPVTLMFTARGLVVAAAEGRWVTAPREPLRGGRGRAPW